MTRKAAGWLVMIVVATNVTYLLASWFLDPRSNYRGLRPVRSEEQIDHALAPYNLDPRVPLADRWWHWFSNVTLHFDWGKSPVG
ncbi:ABC transporter permease, partial [Streptomyces populi]